eukprot:6195203-Pleurochrysis_carterae.AAC.1
MSLIRWKVSIFHAQNGENPMKIRYYIKKWYVPIGVTTANFAILSLAMENLSCPLRYSPPTVGDPKSQKPNLKGQGFPRRAGSDGVGRRLFSGSAADLHLQYFSLSQTEAAGRPRCCSLRGEARAERTPR